MKTKLLILLIAFLSFSSFAENPTTDSIFYKSFNLRYQNPSEGIRIARSLIKSDPQKAHLSLAFNFFFLSNYDSVNTYILKAIQQDKSDKLILNLGHTCRGWIAQRLGKYYDAYQYFDTANTFYENKLFLRKYENNQLFTQGYVLNLLGKLSFQYYYVNDFNKIQKDYDILHDYCKNIEYQIPKNLRAHIQYIFIQNFINNNMDSLSFRLEFRKSILLFNSLIDQNEYYQAGNFYEIFGLLYKNTTKEFLNEILLVHINENSLCRNIHDIINLSTQPKFEILNQSLKYFKKHGDPYQIAGSYYDLAEYYSSLIKNSLDNNSHFNEFLLDSLKKYIWLTKKTYESRDSLYFNSIFTKQNIKIVENSPDIFISKLISFPWYIRTLKLEHYSNGVDVAYVNRREGFNTKLFQLLENEDRKNTSSFYSKMEDILKERIELEKKQYLLKIRFSSIIFSIIFGGAMLFIILRKAQRDNRHKEQLDAEISAKNLIKISKDELQKSKTRLEEWNKVINEVFNIKEQLLQEDIKPVIRAFKTLNKLLREHFDAEYCAIGVPDKGDLKDIAFNFDHELSAEQEAKIKSLSKLPNNKTIIGAFLASEKDSILYNKNDVKKISNSYLRSYETILNSQNIENIALFGLYGEKIAQQVKPVIGYISFINVRYKDDEFSKKMSQLISQIKVILENEDDRNKYRNHLKDEKFVNSLIDSELPITEVIKKSISYLSKEFNAGIISFRVPVINGPDENPVENLKLVLRDLFIDNSISNQKSIDQYYWNDKKTLSLGEVTYKDVMLNNFPEDIYIDEVGQDSSFYARFNLSKVFTSKTNIIFPIRKALLQDNRNEEMSTYWRNIYGVYNLQLYDITDIEQIKGRLKFLSMNISYVINSMISKKKYSQIALLHNEISRLDYEELNPFYDQIANMINVVINAEICSVFIYNKYNNRLELKATTANRAIYNNEEILLSAIEFKEDIYYDMDESESITLQVYKENKTYMIYSLTSYKNTSTKFIELTKLGDKNESKQFSRLIVPLKNLNHNKECFGVIRCLGARFSDKNLIHSFWDFDRETVEFISALAARFIVNAQLSFEKDNFVKQVVHETISPITEMFHRVVNYYNFLESKGIHPRGFETHHRNLVNNIMLQKHILSDLLDVSMNKSDLMNINPSKENIKKILTDIVRLFKDSAFDEKNISIIPSISDLPDMNIDRSKMQQVFINLLKNAINYSYKDSNIFIYYYFIDKYEDGFSNLKWHEIRFVNNGIGIPVNEIKDIFLLYRRGSNASKLKPSGSGIGLFLVDQIIKAHGGFCKVLRPNDPTQISIYLPEKVSKNI